ncbi:MAG: hypothetical protein OXH50_19215 [Gemmatimonadetes bacterium]|nr:hypothetical protein [Gemmatimonadota bacterium]
MSAVPETTEEMMRRNCGSHAAMANWVRDDATMRLASRDSPPSSRASTQIAMKWGVRPPVMSTCPAPQPSDAARLRGGDSSGDDKGCKDRHSR